MTAEALLRATAAALPATAGTPALDQALRRRWMRALAVLVAREPDEQRHASALRYIGMHAQAEGLGMAQLLQPALGRIEREEQQPADALLLHACLLLAAAGCEGSWRIALAQPVSAYFGAYRLQWQGEVSCATDGRHCRISGADTGPLEFTRHGGNWHAAALPGALLEQAALEQAAPEQAALALPVLPAATPGGRDEALLGALPAPACSAAQAVTQLRAALALIAVTSPAQQDWVRRALRGIVVVGTQDGSTTSGSSSTHPGLIFVSWPMDAVQCATLLIHESAHQHLDVLATQAQLTDGDPAKTCYSPFKRARRPVYKVLLALHAAVNMRQFTARLLAAGTCSAFAREEDAELGDGIRQMHAALRDCGALTPLGRQFLALVMRHA
jgi:HEXXH motif-containing protein